MFSVRRTSAQPLGVHGAKTWVSPACCLTVTRENLSGYSSRSVLETDQRCKASSSAQFAWWSWPISGSEFSPSSSSYRSANFRAWIMSWRSMSSGEIRLMKDLPFNFLTEEQMNNLSAANKTHNAVGARFLIVNFSAVEDSPILVKLSTRVFHFCLISSKACCAIPPSTSSVKKPG